MRLVGAELQAAGIGFISVRARHRADCTLIAEAVLPSEADLRRFHVWAAKRGYLICGDVRVGTEEEINEWLQTPEFAEQFEAAIEKAVAKKVKS